MTTRFRAFVRVLVCLAIGVASTLSFGANNQPSGSCVNDVGRGALLWGTSDEVTTYSAPYWGVRSPNIYRIPTTSESTSNPTPTSSETSTVQGNWREKLKEVGTIYGTDGKVYEYHFVEGKEPRRIVEVQRVRETPKGGVAPVEYDKTVERIEWEPVLIRVLRPVGTTERQLKAEMAASQKARAASSSTPAPCEPLGVDEETPRTFAQENEPGVRLADTSNGATPSVVGAERREAENAALDAANEARAAAARNEASAAGQAGGAQATGDSPPTFANGIARVIIPDREPSPAPQPLIVLPKALERTAKTDAPQGKSARR